MVKVISKVVSDLNEWDWDTLFDGTARELSGRDLIGKDGIKRTPAQFAMAARSAAIRKNVRVKISTPRKRPNVACIVCLGERLAKKPRK